MISKTRGIVFHHLKFGDTGIIATVYTEQFGRKSFLIKGVYKAKARFRANMFQPLSLLEMEISLSGKRDLQRVKDVILSNSPANINGNISKQTLIFFIAEVLYKTIREEESNPSLFDFLYHSVLFLDASEIDLANFHLVFLIQLTRFLGFFPRNDFSEQACQFNMLQGSFVPETDTDVHTFSKRLSGKFHLLLELNYANASGLLLSRYERQELLELIMDFYRLHLHSNLNIQSLQVLKELFD